MKDVLFVFRASVVSLLELVKPLAALPFLDGVRVLTLPSSDHRLISARCFLIELYRFILYIVDIFGVYINAD